MPEKETLERAHADAREGKAPSTQAIAIGIAEVVVAAGPFGGASSFRGATLGCGSQGGPDQRAAQSRSPSLTFRGAV